jgi:hypothetical protein
LFGGMNASAIAWRDKARSLRAQQRMIEADDAIAKAHALAPDDRLIAFLHAQSRYELGHPAAELLQRSAACGPTIPTPSATAPWQRRARAIG